MDLSEVERLVSELLATGEMNEDTSADLERILAEARAGQSYPDDLDYLAALHARILSAGAPQASIAAPTAIHEDIETLRRENAQLRAELQDARQIISELEARLIL